MSFFSHAILRSDRHPLRRERQAGRVHSSDFLFRLDKGQSFVLKKNSDSHNTLLNSSACCFKPDYAFSANHRRFFNYYYYYYSGFYFISSRQSRELHSFLSSVLLSIAQSLTSSSVAFKLFGHPRRKTSAGYAFPHSSANTFLFFPSLYIYIQWNPFEKSVKLLHCVKPVYMRKGCITREITRFVVAKQLRYTLPFDWIW